MMNGMKIDLHMHSNVSDGTDTPPELLGKVRQSGIRLFALTDHDGIKGCGIIRDSLREGDPAFLCGAEFSCRDEEGKYHILGYNFDPAGASIRNVVETGHGLRMKKAAERLEYLESAFGFTFSREDREKLLSLDNPGKPHIGNLMVKYGYAESKDQAIHEYMNRVRFPDAYIRPEQAIRGILESGGIPVLAHPAFGSGEELITDQALENRVRRLMGMGLRGVEAFYSGFTPKLRAGVLALAEKYDLLVTAGSDYHGGNKLVALGDTELSQADGLPEGLRRFLEETGQADLIKKE